MLAPTRTENTHRELILVAVVRSIQENTVIRMNDPNFAGSVGDYSYFFEGEDDLLHIAIERKDGAAFPAEEAQEVIAFLLPTVAPGIVWLKPGTHSHHFYVGHDELLAKNSPPR